MKGRAQFAFSIRNPHSALRSRVRFELQATSGSARAGTLTLPHGTVETPAFMPVGTQGTVRALSPADLRAVGAQWCWPTPIIFTCVPVKAVVAKLGGLHRFMAWDRPLLTDSGGFQVFSLEGSRRVSEDGVQFQSHVDGSNRTITPESAVEIQWTPGRGHRDGVRPRIGRRALMERRRGMRMERTVRWLDRCAKTTR